MLANSTSVKTEAGDEYITVAGVDTPLLGLLGTREVRTGRPYWTLPDGSLSYPVKTRQPLPFARRRQVEMDKAAALDRVRRDMPPSYVSLAEMASDWK